MKVKVIRQKRWKSDGGRSEEQNFHLHGTLLMDDQKHFQIYQSKDISTPLIVVK